MPGRRMLPLSLMLFVTLAHAQVYTWVDEKGQKHFSSQPPVAQPVEPVKINHGYIGDGTAVAPQTPYATPSSSSKEAKPSKRQMCTSAIRWGHEDLEDLKTLSTAMMKSGQLSATDNAKVQKDLATGGTMMNMQDCLSSSGESEKRYRCVSEGLGLMLCSGAMEDAMKKAMAEGYKKAKKQ